MKNIEYGEGGIVYCLNQFRCFVSPAKNFNEAVYPVGILIQTPASLSFVNLYLIIWLFRRPMEEILKLLPGPHTETKRVSALIVSLESFMYFSIFVGSFLFCLYFTVSNI